MLQRRMNSVTLLWAAGKTQVQVHVHSIVFPCSQCCRDKEHALRLLSAARLCVQTFRVFSVVFVKPCFPKVCRSRKGPEVYGSIGQRQRGRGGMEGRGRVEAAGHETKPHIDGKRRKNPSLRIVCIHAARPRVAIASLRASRNYPRALL